MPAGDAHQAALAAAHRLPPPGLLAARIDRDCALRAVGDPAARAPCWSFSKTLVAICVLRLAEDGRLTLRAPLLPGHAFTLRQLLRHEAGPGCYGGRAVRRRRGPRLPRPARCARGRLLRPRP